MTATTVRCELTDLLVDQCAHCTGRDGGEAAEMERRELLVLDHLVAQYPGKCAGCGDYFAAGEPLARAKGVGWVASCCIEDGAS